MLKFGLRSIKRSSLSLVLLLVLVLSVATWLLQPLLYSIAPSSPGPFANEGMDPLVIVILGGGVTPEGGAPLHTQERIKVALEVDKEASGKAVFITLSGGTPHKPNPVDKRGFPVWESTAAAKALLAAGIPSERVLEESFSLDTVGNAYFLRAVHTDPAQLRRLVVVTNDWHMPRTRAIFDHVFSLPAVLGGPAPKYDIQYRAALAGVEDERLLALRVEKEGRALTEFSSDVAPFLRSVQEMHGWVFLQHGAYHTARLQKPVENSALPSELLKTY